MRQEQVMDAYEYCRQVTQRASKTFYWGSSFLPQPKRRAIWAIYAFCRVVDDIVDEAVDGQLAVGHLRGSYSPVEALDGWREALTRIYAGERASNNPILQAWSDLLQVYPVPIEPALELIDGVEMDLTRRRYQSFDELYLYCYRVAGTVGLLSSSIFGYLHEDALTHAVELGIALQLTNILRDVGEDVRRDRIYLPLDDMARFSYSERELMDGVINEAFCELIRFQMKRAEAYYQCSHPGINQLHLDCRLAVRLSEVLYHDILERIRLNKYNVFTKRASVPLKTKVMTASRQWMMATSGSLYTRVVEELKRS